MHTLMVRSWPGVPSVCWLNVIPETSLPLKWIPSCMLDHVATCETPIHGEDEKSAMPPPYGVPVRGKTCTESSQASTNSGAVDCGQPTPVQMFRASANDAMYPGITCRSNNVIVEPHDGESDTEVEGNVVVLTITARFSSRKAASLNASANVPFTKIIISV